MNKGPGRKFPKRKGAKPELQPMAKTIQAAMKVRGLTLWTLTEALGMSESQRGAVSNWIAGVNGVSEPLRPKVAAVLGVDEDQLFRSVDAIGRTRTGAGRLIGRPSANLRMPGELGPARQAVQLAEAAVRGGELVPLVPVVDVFTFRARSDGNAVVKLDVSLPFARAAQLMQFLIGFGLAPGAEEHRDG
jgi:transcriptional regulator with XRE-family HTH domain